MRGVKAKSIRRVTYGKGGDFRKREYFILGGIIRADDKRQEYQWRKKVTK